MSDLASPAIDAYCLEHTTPPSPLLSELERYTRDNVPDAGMLTGPVEGALLRLLVTLIGARRVLEIGTFTGYSALTMAEALPPDGRLLTCDIDATVTETARAFWGRSPHGEKITLRLGPALETLQGLEGEAPFDLVFLDADKERYVAYYDACLPRLRAGGLLVADNTLWSGRVLAPSAASDHGIVAFNRRVRDDASVEQVLLPVRDGVMVIRKR